MFGRFSNPVTITGFSRLSDSIISDFDLGEAVAVRAMNGTDVKALRPPNFLNDTRKSSPLKCIIFKVSCMIIARC